MMFTLSQLFWFFFSPLNAATILIGAAVLGLYIGKRKGSAESLAIRTKARMLSGYFGIAAFAVLFVFAVLPTGYYLTSALENRYEAPKEMPRRVNGIIVLGGIMNTDIGLARTTPQFNEGVDRLTTFAKLAQRYPYAKLVYSGGTNTPDGTPEAEMAVEALKLIGFNPRNRLITEGESRTTAQNVRNTKALVEPKEGETWLLVTSAYHMPRAVGAFAAQDWVVTPIPADYLTSGAPSSTWLQNLTMSHIAIKEILGTALYGLTANWKLKPETDTAKP